MLKLLFPAQKEKSVFTIDYEKLFSLGYRGVIFDIDNTLVHHGDDSNPEIDELFKKIHRTGLKSCLITNNDSARVERFIKNIQTQYVCEASKPKTQGYKKAVEILNIEKNQAVFIGDQIFTDILGANKFGADSILVDFIRLDTETYFGKRRKVEAFILHFYKKSKKHFNRLYKKEEQ